MSSVTVKQNNLMNTYNRFPISLVKGKGSYVWNEKGEKFLDYTSGIATCNLGHVPDSVQQKLKEQVDTLWHCSNLYEIPSQHSLAAALTKNSCLDQAFFANSGAEANEAAIKIAKKYAKDSGHPERTEIVTFKSSFHGRTTATLAATGQKKIHDGFTPLTPGFRYLPFNDFEALQQINNEKTTAVLLELVQGEGGVNPADKQWVNELADLCKDKDILLMIDEIQTGIGRTGTLFAYQQYGVEPDVITLAKGLGSGFPIGAMLAKEHVAKSFQPGSHGSTFGGNPLAMTAGLATLEEILEENLLPDVYKKAVWFWNEMETVKQNFNCIKEVRGTGFLIGVELYDEAALVITRFREKGILVLAAGAKVLRILPPLTTSQEELEIFTDTFKQIAAEIDATSTN